MKAWLLALALARGADAASSCAAFAHGAHEANPLLPTSCRAAIGVQIGATVIQGWALSHLAASGHPKAAKVLGALTLSLEVGATAQNLRGIR